MHTLVTNDDGVTAPGLLALADGYASVTPLMLDLTSYDAMAAMCAWPWASAAPEKPEARATRAVAIP
jgi:broad specificity polyphosphatase/5'/3'-nucleotidase SurE